jgi:hypothetical protein
MPRWSCSTRWSKWRLVRWSTAWPSSVRTALGRIALGQLSCPSVVTRAGIMLAAALADRKNARAAAIPRVSLSRTSTKAAELSDGPIQIAPTALDFDVSLVDASAASRLAAPATPRVLGRCRRERGFPIVNSFVGEHDAADEEHLGQVAQAGLVAQAPERQEGDDVREMLGPVRQAGAALVELLAPGATGEPTVTLGGALRPFRNGP